MNGIFGRVLKLLSAMVVLCAAAHIAQAQQVHRCTQSGKTVYSDRPCDAGANVSRVTVKPNSIENSGEREQAEIDSWRREEERQYWAQEHERQSQVAQQAVVRQQEQRYERQYKEMQSSKSRSRSRNRHAHGPTYSNSNPNSSSNPPSNPSPSVMTHCAGSTCFNNQGGVYHGHGNGATMTGPQGRPCIQMGNMVQCH